METSLKMPLVKSVFGLVIAGLAWLSLGFQFYVSGLEVLDFLSYFTTLCNLLIAVSLSCSTLLPYSRPGLFFSTLSVQSAIALYIFIVCLVYNVALRGILVLTGWAYFLDNMVHVVNPVLYILYWLFFRTKGNLEWKDGIKWVFFPAIYLIYSLIRGAVIAWYPYPFLNAGKLGYQKVSLNVVVMLTVFLIGGIILIATTRSKRKVAAN